MSKNDKQQEFLWQNEKNYFKVTFDLFKKILNKSNPKILEIGAHWGQDTIRFCKTFENLDIYCFEPCADTLSILNNVVSKMFILIPEFKGSITVIEKAVCEKHNKKQIFYRPMRTPEATMRAENKMNSPDPFHILKKDGWIAGNLFIEGFKDIYLEADGCSLNKINGTSPIREELVETITLDGWDEQQENELYDLAWIDVQGAEKKIIDGACKTLKKINYVYVEHSQHNYENFLSRTETIKIMKKNGFNYYIDFDNDNLFFGKRAGFPFKRKLRSQLPFIGEQEQ